MKRKILMLLLSASFLLGGCNREVIQEQRHTIPATVVEVKYRAPFQTPYYSVATKTWGYITHPEDYSTFIKCNETIYNLDSKEAYILCKDRVKEEILVEYIMLYFEDGTIETYVEVGGFH